MFKRTSSSLSSHYHTPLETQWDGLGGDGIWRGQSKGTSMGPFCCWNPGKRSVCEHLPSRLHYTLIIISLLAVFVDKLCLIAKTEQVVLKVKVSQPPRISLFTTSFWKSTSAKMCFNWENETKSSILRPLIFFVRQIGKYWEINFGTVGEIDWANLDWYFDFTEHHCIVPKHLNSSLDLTGALHFSPTIFYQIKKCLSSWWLMDGSPNWNNKTFYCKYPAERPDFHADLVWYIQILHSEYFEYFAFYCLASPTSIIICQSRSPLFSPSLLP